MTTLLCEKLNSTVPELFGCEEAGDYYRIFTPFSYLDGDAVEVYARQTGESVFVTDHGQSLDWLLANTMAPSLNRAQSMLFERMARMHGVELIDGCLTDRASFDDLSISISRVAQAAARSSDISLTNKSRSTSDASDKVKVLFDNNGISYQRKPRIAAKSGHSYMLDFVTTGNLPKPSLVSVLNAPAGGVQSGPMYRSISAWSELQVTPEWASNHRFVTIFDDRTDAWRASDYDSLRQFSDVFKLSSGDEIVDRLKSAA